MNQAPDSQQIQVDGIDVYIEGHGHDTIVMIHGWPDTYRLWDEQVAALKGRYRCVRFTLPGFDIAKPRAAYSLDETVDLFRRIIDQVSHDHKVTLMLHDWGCVFGYQFYMRHPVMVSRIIGVDIGDVDSDDYVLTAKAKLMVFSYQVWLAAAWRIGGKTGDAMTRSMARTAKAPGNPATISSRMSYPYYILWAGAHGGYQDALLFKPACPMLYIYGKRKPFMFHSPAWLLELAQHPDSEVLGMDAGHWVMKEQAHAFNEAVIYWLSFSG
ncbi:alpha/beta hydrolase [Undibacterium sp.]|uniref:alpha/beta fold hydrolase n=1 Tax=Undibacterium sp. TaxID=1914977 RepID=UPI002BBE206C|nr:alpha/beta hydrolase [Undibacterium sp.]HTD02204.1 alpha/beta hydrolase [Undibacterium sp.]